MSRPRILFVDDEPDVLDGLRRRFRADRQRWDFDYATSGQEALRIMKGAPCDVIVSDMRMPGMDGADLLHAVAREFPQTIRFVLSGQAEPSAIDRSLFVTHQYLAKPCSIDELRETLNRSFELRSAIKNPEILKLVAGLQTLPSMPSVFRELQTALAHKQPAADEVARIIEHDVAASTKLLQLSNSHFFHFARRVTSVNQAASLLGLEILKGFALAEGLFSEFSSTNIEVGAFVNRVGRHAWGVGMLSRRITSDIGVSSLSDIAFVSGLLHDIGQLVLTSGDAVHLIQIRARCRSENLPFHAAVRDVCGCSTVEIGAYLLGLWGVPFDVVEAVATHRREHAEGTISPAAIIHVANALINEVDRLTDPEADCPPTRESSLLFTWAGVDLLRKWRAVVCQFAAEEQQRSEALSRHFSAQTH